MGTKQNTTSAGNEPVEVFRQFAWHLAGSCGPSLDVEDLMQAGLVALTECAHKHEGPGEDGFADRTKVMEAMQGHILGKATYVGLFKRPS